MNANKQMSDWEEEDVTADNGLGSGSLNEQNTNSRPTSLTPLNSNVLLYMHCPLGF